MNYPVCETPCVFVADDDEDDQFLIQHVFVHHSPECRINVVNNGVELLEALGTVEKLPALVLLDLNMPVMGGLEALALIRKEPQYDSLPVVILTTSNQTVDQQRAMELGANGFVTKPLLLKEYNQLILTLRKQWLIGRCIG
ncbi:response regulator [Larkinella punicea]|uniref:response regulator n=1 Tax=Larkinella punicea TaxID=2315727 RepID=UPI00140289D8|nr:response regulator [Larkinella punicea]